MGFQKRRDGAKWAWWTDIVAAQDTNDLPASIELNEESLVEVLHMKLAIMRA